MEEMVRTALAGFPEPWHLVPGFRLPRLSVGVELVLVTDRAVLVFARDRATAEAAAVDLADFHEGCHGVPVVPVALLSGERVVAQDPLPFAGAAPVIACTRLLLPGLLAGISAWPRVPGLNPTAWTEAPYRPVPALLTAACGLYARHDVAALTLTTSDRGSLARTRDAIASAWAHARQDGGRHVVFVTGEPGSGKTLCGLDLAFTPGQEATFLTGNPALLHVLRAALVRDATAHGLGRRAAEQRVLAVIQPLHGFRDQYAAGGIPPDRVLVIDEAQRCWTAAHAIRKTRNKCVTLSRSEPAHLLDIMNRVDGPCLVLCLLGGGQEIHVGEGGLAAWGDALAEFPHWRASASPQALDAMDARQRLPELPGLTLDPALHLGEPIRAFGSPRSVSWVDAVLRNASIEAAEIAGADLPVRVTRSLPALREALRRDRGRAGLVCSSGGRRLRAEGLGGMLWHQDEDAVARWFLDAWPDIRSADALEVAATEFGIQGLELDRVGLCWDLDLVRSPDGQRWDSRSFRATSWTRPLSGEAESNRLNAYRVLMTRARREMVIWVPLGDPRDPTRDPARYDAVARYLLTCGARPLDVVSACEQHREMPELDLP